MTATPDDAFAAYGRALAKVQCLEQLMRVALGEHQVRREARGGKRVDPQTFSERTLAFDFGTLEQRVCDKFKVDGETRQVMKEGRDFRNYLAHGFWIGHLTDLRSERGIAIVIRHAATLERQIDGVASLLISATGVDAAQYTWYLDSIANDDEKLSGWEALLSESERALDEIEATQMRHDRR